MGSNKLWVKPERLNSSRILKTAKRTESNAEGEE